MTSFGGGLVPTIVPTVFVSDGRLGELLVYRVVQESDVDGIDLAAQSFRVSAADCFHNAVATEEVIVALATNGWSARTSSPCNSRNASALTIDFQNLVLVQIEQLHLLVPSVKSKSHSKRTAPQWPQTW